jgi:hypothetical protein
VDHEFRATLQLIEVSIRDQETRVRGKHLIFLVKDYIEADELLYARSLIRQIPATYFEQYMYQQAEEDGLFRAALARVIETFGLGWTVLSLNTAYDA